MRDDTHSRGDALGRVDRLVAGSEGRERAVERDERAEEGAELRGQVDPVVVDEPQQVVEHRGARDRPRAEVPGHEARERALELLVVDAPAQRRDAEQRLAQGLGIVVGDTDHDVADRGLLDRIDDTGCTEVDQPEPAVGQHHDVPGMRVGVVAAVDEHLLQHRAQERVGELDGGRAHGEEVARVAHAAAVEPFHHEDARGREVVEHARDTHGRVLGQVRADLRRVAGLDAVVELLLEAVAELLGEVDDPVVGTPGRAGLDRVRELRRARRGRAAPTPRHPAAAP